MFKRKKRYWILPIIVLLAAALGLPRLATLLADCPIYNNGDTDSFTAGDLLSLYGSLIGVYGVIGSVLATNFLQKADRDRQIAPHLRIEVESSNNYAFTLKIENYGDYPIFDVWLEGVPLCQTISPREAFSKTVYFPYADPSKTPRTNPLLNQSKEFLSLYVDKVFDDDQPVDYELSCFDVERTFRTVILVKCSDRPRFYYEKEG